MRGEVDVGDWMWGGVRVEEKDDDDKEEKLVVVQEKEEEQVCT